uniref:Uncharacterized protein n=1 Tax=Myoviridae sp. ctshb19 TaxID=2825194 RepID=A0A8S5UGV6_9CAUD|nr:MAG TPA: hypothetical protein [Myoviridae sp. ctshb19]
MAPQDNHKSKAKRTLVRIRPLADGSGFKAYNYKGYYAGYGKTMQKAFENHRKIICELT